MLTRAAGATTWWMVSDAPPTHHPACRIGYTLDDHGVTVYLRPVAE